MPTEWATAKADELLPCHPTCGLQDPKVSRHHDDCPRVHRPAVAAALDAAREQGRKEGAADRAEWAEALSMLTPAGEANFGPAVCREAIERRFARLAAERDEARKQGAEKERERWRKRIEAEFEREKRLVNDDDFGGSIEGHEQCAVVLRGLLEEGDRVNEYRPWEQTGETELAYFRRRFLEESARADQLCECARRTVEAVELAVDPSAIVSWDFLKLQLRLRGVQLKLHGDNPAAAPAAPPPGHRSEAESWAATFFTADPLRDAARAGIAAGAGDFDAAERCGLAARRAEAEMDRLAPAVPPEPPGRWVKVEDGLPPIGDGR